MKRKETSLFSLPRVFRAFFQLAAFALFPSVCGAEALVYITDRDIEAVFPAQPSLVGKTNLEGQKTRSYQALDPDNGLAFALTITSYIGDQNISGNTEYFKQVAQGDALAVSGKITSFETALVSNLPAASYEIRYSIGKMNVIKNSLVTYTPNRLISWSVSEVYRLTSGIGELVFEKHRNRFKIINGAVAQNSVDAAQNYVSKFSSGLPKTVAPNLELVSVSLNGSIVTRKFLYSGPTDFKSRFNLFFEEGMFISLSNSGKICNDSDYLKMFNENYTLRDQLYFGSKLQNQDDYDSAKCLSYFHGIIERGGR